MSLDNAQQAMSALKTALLSDRTEVMDADPAVRDCSDSLPHRELLRLDARRVSDKSLPRKRRRQVAARQEAVAVLAIRNKYGAAGWPFGVSFPSVNWPQQCAVVIPCRNEARAIAPLVRAVHAHLPQVIVVNDGSTDDTAAQAAGAGAEVVAGAATPGKGAALRIGWQRARERGFAWALCLDGDGQHAAGDIPAFLACAETTAASLIVGNRMNQAEQMPWVRRLVNRWMSRRLSRFAGHALPDSQCGFRLLRLAALDRVPLRADQFEIESEQLLAFLAAGECVEFVPVQVIYRTEQSKIHPWRDTWRWFRWRREWLKSSARPQSGASQNKNGPSRP